MSNDNGETLIEQEEAITDRFNSSLASLQLAPGTLATLCGVTRQTVWKWRKGVLPPPTYAMTIVDQLAHIRRTLKALLVARGLGHHMNDSRPPVARSNTP